MTIKYSELYELKLHTDQALQCRSILLCRVSHYCYNYQILDLQKNVSYVLLMKLHTFNIYRYVCVALIMSLIQHISKQISLLSK